MSQSEKASSLVFCFFFHTAKKGKKKKRKKKKNPKLSADVLERGAAAGPSAPAVQGRGRCAGVRANQPRPPPHAAVFAAAHVLTHCVSRPTGGIRNSKFSKQFQYFQYICWDFIMVHRQKRFSTSHTQTLVRFLFSAFLYSVGPIQTATLKCSGQPCRGRTPHPCRCRG